MPANIALMVGIEVTTRIEVAKYLGHSEKDQGKLVRTVYGHLYDIKETSILNSLLDEL